MSRATAARLASAALLLAVAVLLVLLARDAWHWGRAMRNADARAAVTPIGPDAWQAATTLPAGLMRRILGIDDDLAFRRAAMGIYGSKAKPLSTSQVILLETELARIAQTDPNHVRASRAADYLGLLLYADRAQPHQAISPYVKPNSTGAPSTATPEEKAAAEFATAVRLDPTNDNAKRNLEEMLRAASAPSQQGTAKPGSGERAGSKGSGSRPPGYGY